MTDVIITKFLPLCFKMAESFENLDNILLDWEKDTAPPETMDPSGPGKTLALPCAFTSRPPQVKIWCTAVRASVTEIEKYSGKKDEVIPRGSNI